MDKKIAGFLGETTFLQRIILLAIIIVGVMVIKYPNIAVNVLMKFLPVSAALRG